MEKYNYLENVTADAKQAILENLNDWEFSDREELEEIANDELWVDDSVTGNGSGSYTFNTWKAEENLCHNMDELENASCSQSNSRTASRSVSIPSSDLVTYSLAASLLKV